MTIINTLMTVVCHLYDDDSNHTLMMMVLCHLYDADCSSVLTVHTWLP